jgi:hypothetical protein
LTLSLLVHLTSEQASALPEYEFEKLSGVYIRQTNASDTLASLVVGGVHPTNIPGVESQADVE